MIFVGVEGRTILVVSWGAEDVGVTEIYWDLLASFFDGEKAEVVATEKTGFMHTQRITVRARFKQDNEKDNGIYIQYLSYAYKY